jgi:hypothetical protein
MKAMKVSYFLILLFLIALGVGCFFLYNNSKNKEMKENKVIFVNRAETRDQKVWFGGDLSPDERTALVEKSKNVPFEKIAPELLKGLLGGMPVWGSQPGETPWNNKNLHPLDRAYLMAHEVWYHHIRTIEELAKAKYLLSLLQKATSYPEKYILIEAIMDYQWCSDAEVVIYDMFTKSIDDPYLRDKLLSTLLHRCEINTYMYLAIESILSCKKGLPRCEKFKIINTKDNRLLLLNDKNRQLMLTTGFEIINELSNEERHGGYYIARTLGAILKIPGEFAPDQKAIKYQGKHGLTDEFFLETVRNAIKWYLENKKEILESLGKPTEIYSGFQNYGKSVPLDNIDLTFYYQLKSGELFIYFQNKVCVKSKFKPTGIEY